MKPLVSILIPAFNAQEWIADTIRSALDQTWPRKEIIIVDDGSTDRTLEIAQQFASTEVRVVTQSNHGAAAARNKAFSLCQGDYIQWLDADDLLAPDKIARQLEALPPGGCRRTLLSSSWGIFAYRPSKADFSPSPLWSDLTPTEWLLLKMEQPVYMQTTSWLVSRELTEAAGPWNTRLLGDDDGEYFCRVILASDGIRFVPHAKAFHRNVGSNRLSYVGTSDRKLEAHFLSMQLHVRYVRSLGDTERARRACRAYLQRYMIYFYPRRADIVAQLQELARDLGGELSLPRLPWKYAAVRKLCGWDCARRTQLALPRIKWSVIEFCDKVLFWVETRSMRRRAGQFGRQS